VSAPADAAIELRAMPTPFALIDTVRLDRNLHAMQRRVEALGARLRPHFKTHRSVELAMRQRELGAAGFTCSDVAQLNALLDHDTGQLFLSSPVQLDPATRPALRRAARAGRVTFAISSDASLDALVAAVGGTSAAVLVEVDVGCRRTGVAPDRCGALAARAVGSGLELHGLFSYPGQSYLPGAAEPVAEDERAELSRAEDSLRAHGLAAVIVSGGSTPTMCHAQAGVVNEYRPGSYALGDRQQVVIGGVSKDQLAIALVATVLQAGSDGVVLDAGGKALGRDAPAWLDGHGTVGGSDGPVISRLYDHHAVIDRWDGPRPSEGERVMVVPNNVNSALALQSAVVLAPPGDARGVLVNLIHDA
jgi:D-serine deaminase-like pyridoxal phosphate-dependent protein